MLDADSQKVQVVQPEGSTGTDVPSELTASGLALKAREFPVQPAHHAGEVKMIGSRPVFASAWVLNALIQATIAA